jgi:tetratricopeptide (TPR) repeat protein
MDFTECVTRKPSHAEACFARAEAFAVTGQNQGAFDDYLRAAEIFQFRKEYGQAINSYTRAIEIDNKAIAPLLGRANVYLSKDEQIAAIADFETAKKLDDRNAQAHYGLGRARFEQGYYKKAVDHFKDARKIEPENPVIYQYLMLSYMGANDIKNVKKAYEKFIEIATEQQLQDLMEDGRFTAVRKIVELDS